MEPAAYLRTDCGDCRQLQVPGLYTFGRASTSDFRPNTKSVSKRHAQLELLVNQTTGKTEAWLEDYNSTFGTYVGVSPTALEKISERSRLFFGLYLRFGHAPLCYQYLEFPDSREPAPLAIPVSSLHFDERSVADTIKSGNARRLKRVPLSVNAEEELALQMERRAQEESPRSRIQVLVNHFEAKSPVNSPDANKSGGGVKRGSSGNLSIDSNQVVMDMVTKIEQSPTHHNLSTNSMNSLSGKESFTFRGATPSPETSSKTHPHQSSQTSMISVANVLPRGPSPDVGFQSSDYNSQSDSSPRIPSRNTSKRAMRAECDWTGIAEAPSASIDSTEAPIVAPITTSEETPDLVKPPSRAFSSPSPANLPVETEVSPPTLAPAKESDSAKELDYSIYDYDLDEKLGASESALSVPANAFRRNPSLWEDPALFDALQESTSTRSMRSTPQLPSRPLSTHNAPPAAANAPTVSDTVASTEQPLSLREQAIAELAQRNVLITQSRHAFCDKKNAVLNPAADQYPTYKAVAKQWKRAVASVDPVDGGMCISLVLPSMRKVKIQICGHKKTKVRVEARRQLYYGDDVATDRDSEYLCEYKLDGLTTALHFSDVSHEYTLSTGLLCIFVNHVTPQDKQLFVQKHDLTGAACVPYEPAQDRGSSMSKWLPRWLRGGKGDKGGKVVKKQPKPSESKEDQKSNQRALQESTKENHVDPVEKNDSVSSKRRSIKKAATSERALETNASADVVKGEGADSTDRRSKRTSSPRGASINNNKSGSKQTKCDNTRLKEPTISATGRGTPEPPVVDRASLLQEFIEKGEVGDNVEFI